MPCPYDRLFPGHQAGASLKRRLRLALRGLRRPLPRSPSRGLIEAPARSECPCAPARPLPRSPSRGLIEASERSGRSARGCRHLFPGHQAGASLKPGVQDSRRIRQASSLPRSPSRGLIEARRRPPGPPPPSALFPGHQAGASLKPGGAPAAAVQRPPLFPGHQAGASLKRVVGFLHGVLLLLSSPVTKPGPH